MMPDPVIKTIEVPCPPDTAFRIFTEDMTRWWPRDQNSVSAMDGKTAQAVNIQPFVGGTITETGHDGTLHHWGSVVTFDPGSRLELLWHINKPAEKATHVDVSFEALADGTRITLTHSGWQVLGDEAAGQREGYNSGWVNVFEVAYANACKDKVA